MIKFLNKILLYLTIKYTKILKQLLFITPIFNSNKLYKVKSYLNIFHKLYYIHNFLYYLSNNYLFYSYIFQKFYSLFKK